MTGAEGGGLDADDGGGGVNAERNPLKRSLQLFLFDLLSGTLSQTILRQVQYNNNKKFTH